MTERDEGGIGVIHRLAYMDVYRFVRRFAGTSDQERGPAFDDFGRDCGDLGGTLAQAEDHLREPLADRAVVIDASEPEVLERLGAERFEELISSGLCVEVAPCDLIEQIL